MWTKDYLIRGFLRRQRGRRLRPVSDYADEWQALYRVEGARRRLKAARKEAEEQHRLVLLWDAAKARGEVAAAERAEAFRRDKEAEERLRKGEVERWAEEAAKISAEARAEATDQTVWCAWAWANGKKQLDIAKEMGFGNSTQVNQECRRYVLAHYPENLYRDERFHDRVDHRGDRHTLIKLALAGTPEPQRPGRWRAVPQPPPLAAPAAIPAGPQPAGSSVDYRAKSRERRRWVWEQRQAGFTLEQVGQAIGLSKERIRQMAMSYQDYLDRRQYTLWLWYATRAAKNVGRPIDMGGPRDTWLEYRLGDPE